MWEKNHKNWITVTQKRNLGSSGSQRETRFLKARSIKMKCRGISPLPEVLPCCEDSLPVRDRSVWASSLRQLGSLKTTEKAYKDLQTPVGWKGWQLWEFQCLAAAAGPNKTKVVKQELHTICFSVHIITDSSCQMMLMQVIFLTQLCVNNCFFCSFFWSAICLPRWNVESGPQMKINLYTYLSRSTQIMWVQSL